MIRYHKGYKNNNRPEEKVVNTKSLIKDHKGLTLVEVLAASVIIVVAAVGIYIGIIVAESYLQRNYHYRAAALLASGECDWQYYNRVYFDSFDEFIGAKPVVIDYHEGTDNPPLMGSKTMNLTENVDIVFGRVMRYMSLEVSITWEEPLAGERIVVVREDIFR